MRFELTTSTLARLRSTPELRPHPVGYDVSAGSGDKAHRAGFRKRKNHFRLIFPEFFYPDVSSAPNSLTNSGNVEQKLAHKGFLRACSLATLCVDFLNAR